MTPSETPGESGEPGPRRADTQEPARLALLTLATRALAGADADAEDATLLALLGPIVVSALGDVAALYAVDPAGEVSLVAAAPADAAVARHLREHLQQHPTAAAGYAAGAAGGQPRLVSGTPTGRALGLGAEVVAPLDDGLGQAALLVIGTANPDRRYADADLATVDVLAALLAARRSLRELRRREASLRRQIEASTLAGRELAHRLNNDLTMPVGVVELLLDRGPLGSDLQEMLEAAANDLAALERHIHAFHDQMRSQSGAPAGPRPPGS